MKLPTSKHFTTVDSFLSEYNNDENFRSDVENSYDIYTYSLSLLEIYTLEEIIGYNRYNIYKSYMELKKDDVSTEDHINAYETFRQRITSDEKFAFEKYNDIYSLNQTEIFIIMMIIQSVARENNFELYDPLNPIENNSEEDFFRMLRNHRINIIATAIADRHPGVFKQRAKGQFSPESKEALIDIIRQKPFFKEEIEIFIWFVKNFPRNFFFVINWHKYNTNISYDEVFGDSKKPKSKK